MLALLVDRGDRGFTASEGIACLWPDRASDASTQSLLRMTYKRLLATLENAGVANILATRDNRRYLKTSAVECDLYRILNGDKQAARKYNGAYLQEYEWAEERNAQLYWILGGGQMSLTRRQMATQRNSRGPLPEIAVAISGIFLRRTQNILRSCIFAL